MLPGRRTSRTRRPTGIRAASSTRHRRRESEAPSGANTRAASVDGRGDTDKNGDVESPDAAENEIEDVSDSGVIFIFLEPFLGVRVAAMDKSAFRDA